jgi:hypothetical protein
VPVIRQFVGHLMVSLMHTGADFLLLDSIEHPLQFLILACRKQLVSHRKDLAILLLNVALEQLRVFQQVLPDYLDRLANRRDVLPALLVFSQQSRQGFLRTGQAMLAQPWEQALLFLRVVASIHKGREEVQHLAQPPPVRGMAFSRGLSLPLRRPHYQQDHVMLVFENLSDFVRHGPAPIDAALKAL